MLRFIFYVNDVVKTEETRALLQNYYNLIRGSISRYDKKYELRESTIGNNNFYTMYLKDSEEPIYMIDEPYLIQPDIIESEDKHGMYGFHLSILNNGTKDTTYYIPLDKVLGYSKYKDIDKKGGDGHSYLKIMFDGDDIMTNYHQFIIRRAIHGNISCMGMNISLSDIVYYRQPNKANKESTFFNLYIFGDGEINTNIFVNLDTIDDSNFAIY